MQEFDYVLNKLKAIVRENVYVEDDKTYIKCKLKYDIFNFVEELDAKFIESLIKEKSVLEEEIND